MYAEILDGLFWTGYKPPFHEKTYVLREIKLVKDWKGNSHWITIGNDIMESNSLSELKDYCKENCIELVRRIVLRFAAMPECRYEEGYEKHQYYVIPNDSRSKCPTF